MSPISAHRAAERRVRMLAEMAAIGRIVVPIDVLARRLGIDRPSAWEVAGEAERSGEVARWSAGKQGPSVVFTPLTAARLELRPSRSSTVWLKPGQADIPERSPQRFGPNQPTGLVPGLDDRADPNSAMLSAIPGRRKMGHRSMV